MVSDPGPFSEQAQRLLDAMLLPSIIVLTSAFEKLTVDWAWRSFRFPIAPSPVVVESAARFALDYELEQTLVMKRAVPTDRGITPSVTRATALAQELWVTILTEVTRREDFLLMHNAVSPTTGAIRLDAERMAIINPRDPRRLVGDDRSVELYPVLYPVASPAISAKFPLFAPLSEKDVQGVADRYLPLPSRALICTLPLAAYPLIDEFNLVALEALCAALEMGGNEARAKTEASISKNADTLG